MFYEIIQVFAFSLSLYHFIRYDCHFLKHDGCFLRMDKAGADKELIAIFDDLVEEYFNPNVFTSSHSSDVKIAIDVARTVNIDFKNEKRIIAAFLKKDCGCGKNCQKLFTREELFDARVKFQKLTTAEKNCFILSLLYSFSRYSDFSRSARVATSRKRQKFEYKINVDRPVCKNVFLFYFGESIDRLKRLQKNLFNNGIEPPTHGNKGCQPANTYSMSTRETLKSFIINLAANQGLPDPGRDVRNGKGCLRIFLPSVMNYLSIHKLYEQCVIEQGYEAIGYRTFLNIWKEELPHIVFNNPKTDLCIKCEDFKKRINQVSAILSEEKEEAQAKIYQEAIDHLNHAKRERLYYKAHAKLASMNYKKVSNDKCVPVKANSRDMMMHYSWDFAQQLQYPFEDQQVGPIYFKTPRRSQLFGVCCEGIPRQINYLIDEADFLEKNANTVISLLDHFFLNHGLGETSAYLTADNCVGQNKNNALIQYLMYRVLMGLHNQIELSFLVVGHTKFSPDGYFGLIRHRYRRSKVYTYEQLGKVIEESSPNSHNVCQFYRDDNHSEIIYRDWSGWLDRYFKAIPDITSYHHFKIDHKKKGIIELKENVDSEGVMINLIKENKFPFDKRNQPKRLPGRLMPKGLSAERQWYLYDKIRVHIPDIYDKNKTCPKPKINKP